MASIVSRIVIGRVTNHTSVTSVSGVMRCEPKSPVHGGWVQFDEGLAVDILRQDLKHLRGKRLGREPKEVEHFVTCAACGQSFDMRSLAQAFHHNETGHHRLTDAERTEFDPSGPHSGTGVLSGRRN
jgi:hypothetical protein